PRRRLRPRGAVLPRRQARRRRARRAQGDARRALQARGTDGAKGPPRDRVARPLAGAGAGAGPDARARQAARRRRAHARRPGGVAPGDAMKVRTAILAGVLIVVGAALAALVWGMSSLIDRRVRRQVTEELQRSRQVFEDLQAYRQSLFSAEIRVVAE